MSLQMKVITEVAIDLAAKGTISVATGTPFSPGFNAIAFNNSGTAATVQHSDDGTTYSTAATLGVGTSATAMQPIPNLKRYVKLQAAGSVFLLGAI